MTVFLSHGQLDRTAVFRKLAGVRQQIGKYLLQTHLITFEHRLLQITRYKNFICLLLTSA